MPDPIKKIGVAIYGGLGNQMFQYASALGIAKHHNANLFLDLSWFKVADKLANTTPRKFALEVFNIYHEENSALFSQKSTSIFGRCKRKIVRVFPALFAKEAIYNEQQFSGDNADANAICVHIRRGDYVTNTVASETHGVCDIEYYQDGIQQIAKNLSQPHCFIFSDDIEWARANLLTNIPMTFVDFNGPNEAHQDLWLMAACKHFVIANSSLSWWGAYLGRHPGKQVIAPKHWFRDKALNTSDLYLADWIRI